MKNFQLTTPMILGIITIVEMVACHSAGVSVLLWIGYGVWRVAKDLW